MANGDFGRALVMSSDLKGYGGGNDKRHEAMQRGFVEVHRGAAARAGLDRTAWAIQAAGDGELAVLPSNDPDPVVVDGYVRALHQELTERNRGLPPRERLRLRVAFAFGTAYPCVNGYAGQAVVEASRLVDWGPLKRLLDRAEEASIALILSGRVFEDVIRQGHTSYAEEDFHRVAVRVKEFSGPAWIWVPELTSEELRDLLATAEEEADEKARAATIGHQTAEVINNVNGPVKAQEISFGIVRK
ncbi:hypothetical protein GCM10010466_24850 [Planomonospora alba]|uniref:Uncharacterized protein n=1 Tax=Planomonospora alba TaxID=161354 RepID=A0ABP6N189_9ACTN